MSLSRRKFTKEFKMAAVRRLETGATAAEVARACEVNANVLHRWRREFRDGVDRAFPGLGRKKADETKVAELERKIGQQTLEIDFLKRALQRVEEARMLQALAHPTPFISKSKEKPNRRSQYACVCIRNDLRKRSRGSLHSQHRARTWD